MLPLVLSTLCLTQVDANWQVGLRNELRARTIDLTDRPSVLPFAVDFELQPSGQVDVSGRTYRFVTSYAPRLIMRNIDGGDVKPTVLHRWQGDITWRVSRTFTLLLS